MTISRPLSWPKRPTFSVCSPIAINYVQISRSELYFIVFYLTTYIMRFPQKCSQTRSEVRERWG